MFCTNCGVEINEGSKFCQSCGEKIDKNHVNDKEGISSHKNRGNHDDLELDRWSWGAAVLPFLYFISMNDSAWIFFLITNTLAYHFGGWIGGTIQIITGIFAGAIGRQQSWAYRNWKNEEEFKTVQNIWDGWGLSIFVIVVILYILVFFGKFSQ